jgi:hypothetical protein
MFCTPFRRNRRKALKPDYWDKLRADSREKDDKDLAASWRATRWTPPLRSSYGSHPGAAWLFPDAEHDAQ